MCHAVPGEESEFLSLAEWSANAIAYSQCAKIPFFRSYAQTKAFHSWNINVQHPTNLHVLPCILASLLTRRGHSKTAKSNSCRRSRVETEEEQQ